MRRLILLLCFVMLFAPLCWATEASEEELLAKLEEVKQPAARFAIYEEYINAYRHEPVKRLRCVDMMLEEATTRQDERHMAQAYLYHIFNDYNAQNLEQTQQWMAKLEPLARRNKYHDLLFQGLECLADLLIYSSHFERAELQAEQILYEAQQLKYAEGVVIGYKCLANVYKGTYRTSEALELFEKAYLLADGVQDQKYKFEIVSSLIYIYQLQSNYASWIKYLRIREADIMKQIGRNPENSRQYRGDLLLLYLSYLRYYVKTENLESAKLYKELAEDYYSDDYLAYQFNFNWEMINYYNYTKEFDKALAATEKQLELMRRYVPRNYAIFMDEKAKILNRMGRNSEAFEVSKQSLFIKDTMLLSVYKTQIDQVKANYNSSQSKLTQLNAQRAFQCTVLGVVALFILVCCVLAYKSHKMRDAMRRSEGELLRIASEVDKATRIKEHFLSNISYAIQIPLNRVVESSLMLASDQQIEIDKRAEIAASILHTTNDLMVLVEEILDLSRLESGRMKFALSNVDVQMMILNLVGTLPSGACVVKNFDEELKPIWVEIDGRRLSQILANLIAYTQGVVSVDLTMSDDHTLAVTIVNPTLLSTATSQEWIIRNEIHRMTIQHFGGHYEVVGDTAQLTFVVKTLEA